MTIAPTRKPPAPPTPGPVDKIAKALSGRDWGRWSLTKIEQDLAITVANQPPFYREAFRAFRDAGGSTEEEWKEWTKTLAYDNPLPRRRFRRLKLAE